jgi:4-amino-4-deoxy-L-arabinose transferase-like glycosyltransferase
MAMESARHPITIGNLRPFAAYFVLSSPFVALTIPLLLIKGLRRDLSKLLIWLAAAGLFATALLFLNYSTTINWRYFLTGLPALAPLAASLCLTAISAFTGSRSKALGVAAAVLVALTLVAAILVKPLFDKMAIKRVNSRDYITSLSTLPQDSVVIAGAQTVAINYWHGIGAGNWETIGTGGGWPGDKLTEVIDRNMAAGKPVFLDADPRWWSPCGWQKSETEAIAALKPHYRFRRLNGTIFQLRPLTDLTAQDVPNLSALLPENRPADRAQCLSGD